MFGLLSTCKFDTKQGRLSDFVQIWPYAVTDKHRDHNYISYYDEWFAPYKQREVKVLEIGVKHGVTLALWDEYFVNNQGIWGIDVKITGWAKRLAAKHTGIHLISGGSDDAALANSITETFDIIIDDGCHIQKIQMETWKNYFPKLKTGGLYILEDFEPVEDLDKEIQPFVDLWNNVEVIDRRDYRNREDNVLVLYRKSP